MKNTSIYILGSAQDGGYPQSGCYEDCCKTAWSNENLVRYPSSIAVVNHLLKKYWIFDITPDIKFQINLLPKDYILSGIFITHAHSGHYMGLVQLGIEVMNLKDIPVYVMPRMASFLENNSLFSQLILSGNIKLERINIDAVIKLPNQIHISNFEVPHRNELSETVGYKISGEKKSVIYLPDIDSWDNFHTKLFKLIENNDYLFIDGTFYDSSELKYRKMNKVPHPLISSTIEDTLSNLSLNNRNKIYFTHLNHTNKVLNKDSKAYQNVISNGFKILNEKDQFQL